MKKKIDWSKLERGFRGFEDLALEFVQEQYKEYTWEKTGETRDGNKDGVAVVMGYQNTAQSQTYWWMEAKYSETGKRLTRYRLDATIVSAILEGNVSQVVFVTNSLVNTKTITDIRLALSRAISCKNIDFCSKYTLEYWLYNHQDIYRKYFVDKECSLAEPALFITQEIDYYLMTSEYANYREPLRQIRTNESYVAYFSVFSPQNLSLPLRVKQNIKGISILSDSNVSIQHGENQVKFYFKIEKQYSDIDEKKSLPILEFELGDLEVTSYNPLIPLDSKNLFFEIPTQTSINNNIMAHYQSFVNQNTSSLSIIVGNSGVGKTYLIDLLMKHFSIIENDIFLCTLEESHKVNSKIIVKLIIFILLPYVDVETIDIQYIERFENPDIRCFLLQLFHAYDDYEELINLYSTLSREDLIMPFKVQINPRIIILDNIHFLNDITANFLSNVLLCLLDLKIPVFVILSGQVSFLYSSAYQLLQENYTLNLQQLILSINDIAVCLPQKFFNNLSKFEKQSFFKDLSMFEVFIYAQYLLESNDEIATIEQFILSFRIFQKSSILENAIIEKFRKLFNMYPECKNICNKIYWSFSSVSYEENYEFESVVNKLIIAELIKFNYDNKLVPYHDIYKKFYRQHYKPTSWKVMGYAPNSAEFLQNSIINDIQFRKLKNTAEAIFDIFEKKQFHTVLYILSSVFEDNALIGNVKERLKKNLPEEIYYKLFLIYGLAAHQQSTDISCKHIFEEIYTQTCNSINLKMLEISKSAAWELCVIAHESLEYQKVSEISKDIYDLIEKIQKLKGQYEDIKKSISFHDVEVVRLLIHSDFTVDMLDEEYKNCIKSMLQYGFDYRYESFRARYALTLCNKDIDLCISLLEEGKKSIGQKYGKQDKHYLWCKFYYHFYMLISKNDTSNLTKMLETHEDMRITQNGNYRKKIYAIAAYFYSTGNIVTGDQYLFKDAFFSRKIRNRQKAFYYEVLALREAINNNTSKSIEYLDIAAHIFREIKTYKDIVIHNSRLIQSGNFSNKHIKFWLGESMKPEVYYIDSRCAW